MDNTNSSDISTSNNAKSQAKYPKQKMDDIPIVCYTIGEDGNLVSWNDASETEDSNISDKLNSFIPAAVELIEKEKLKYTSGLEKDLIKLEENIQKKIDSIIIIHPNLADVVDNLSQKISDEEIKNRPISEERLNSAAYELFKEFAPISNSQFSYNEFKGIVDTSTDIFWKIDTSSKFTVVNPITEKYFGVNTSEIIGKSIYEFMDINSIIYVSEMINNTLKEKNDKIKFECSFIERNGNSRIFESKCQPIYNNEETLVGLTGVSRELDSRKKFEQDLVDKTDQLLDLMEQKDLVLDMIAHDLRNSGNVINGIAQVLLEKNPDNEMFNLILDSCTKMLKVLDDAIRFSQIYNKDELKKEKLNLKKIVNNALTEYMPRIKERNIDVLVDFDKNFTIWASPLIESVIENYISNVIKHYPDGDKIVISATIMNGDTILKVKDFGETIPEWDRNFVFERGIRLLDEKRTGRGLGLSIVKKIIEAHEGTVWVEPNQPKGNRFCFKIPNQD